jgi:enamine deaminase RidA (YjgF/YER057c/UK114 family)
MSRPDDRLRQLGIELPALRPKAGNYLGYVQVGNLLYLAGQGADGWVGRLGDDLDIKAGRSAARQCMLNLLAQAQDALGSLDRIARIVKVLGLVTCTEDFRDAPIVLDAASDLLCDLFGDAGAHARSAVGVQALPLGFAVEIEMILEVAA